MPRYKLTLAYEGTEFHGWQKQHPPDAEPLRTAQGVLENTLRHVLRERITVLGASRTDSGVHARCQIAVFSSTGDLAPASLVRAVNARLPDDLQVKRARFIRDRFDPIQDAVRKGYRYRLAYGDPRCTRPPLFARRTMTFAPWALCPLRMNQAAQHLVGEHDFASFTRAGHGRESTIRTVDHCCVLEEGRHSLAIDVSGNGFLYNMVRIIAGTLIEVGRGRIEPDAVPGILAACDRQQAGPTLPPEGLILLWIRYRQPNDP